MGWWVSSNIYAFLRHHKAVNITFFVCFINGAFIGSGWSKVNKDGPVCFGAKNNSYGKFDLHTSGGIAALKLTHISGAVSNGRNNGGANWGSPSRKIRTIVTNERNKVLLPENYHLFYPNAYTLEGYRSTSPEIVFRLASVSPAHDPVTKVLKIWFVEDLFDYSQKDNSGETCADVFVLHP